MKAENTCPVNSLKRLLTEKIASGDLLDPKITHICEQILAQVLQITQGKAGEHHLHTMDTLTKDLVQFEGAAAIQDFGKVVETILFNHRESFIDHIESRNCPSHDCGALSPSPCQMACPAGIDVPGYLSLIARGEDARAIDVIRRDNPLPWICGLVCTRPCETHCVRSRIDTPISIKTLKAFAAQKAMASGDYQLPEKAPDTGRNVCVVGAGPGGLSAAYYLALAGYRVRVIEALPVPGGMLMVGIPRYRLPKDVIDRETGLIESLGVEFVYNTRFGVDVTLDELKREGFEAFFIAIGAHKAWSLGIRGEKDYPKVLDAVEFLKDVALGSRTAPGKDVVVIGGGNVAIDAARTSLRLGATSVTVAYRRSEEQMPADHEEIEQAKEEGVQFAFLTIPQEIVGEKDQITGLACIRADLVKKEGSSRLAPVPIDGSEFQITTDVIISAIGQYVDDQGLQTFDAVTWSKRGTIEVDPVTMATQMPGVFAAGDAVTGPATVIAAVAGGKRAARAIDRYFKKRPQPSALRTPVRRTREPVAVMPAAEKMALKRPAMPMLPDDQRLTTFDLVELGFDEDTARKEAARCLRCDICQRCGLCVEICRDKMGINALHLGYLADDAGQESDFEKTAETCTTCGACAVNCENNAMVIEEKDGQRMLKLCGTVLNSQPVQYCAACNSVLPPERYKQFVRSALKNTIPFKQDWLLCDQCRRKSAAVAFSQTMPADGM